MCLCSVLKQTHHYIALEFNYCDETLSWNLTWSCSATGLLTFLSCSTRGGSKPQVMSCWICLQGPAAIFDKAQAASFCTLAFGCLISWGRTFRTPASIAIWVWTSEPLTMFPMERRAGVCRARIFQELQKASNLQWLNAGSLPWCWAPCGS